MTAASILLAAAAVAAAAPLDLAPGTRYADEIPTLKEVLGHEPGEEITSPEGIVTYLEALHRAAPDRTRLVRYAQTWEGRPLHVLLVASPQRIARLDEVKAGLKRLADPRGLQPAEAEQLVRELPVVTWLMHAVHGNEISSSDAALAEAYHLLAARDDPAVDVIVRESMVLIDPLQNPDGRARFLAQNLLGRAMEPDPEPASAEHDEPWPGGRSNHYLFDMNRDWFAQSQPETVGRSRLYLEWLPHVVVDLHEMGGNSTYYFAPPAVPVNPHVTGRQQAWFDAFGRANAARFDERGFAYFIRENYDSFYPGYGESWPLFHGAVGMTYEQASARGLRFRRDDESTLTYRDGVVRHFTAAVTTAETAARNREALLRDFLGFRRTAVDEGGKGPVREYLIPPGTDPARLDRLARLLLAQGIEVGRASEPVQAGGRTLPAGTAVVRAAQPSSRLLRNLLEPHVPMEEPFVEEQDRRRKKRLPDQIYDVTAWSLPLLFDLECVATDRATDVRTAPWPEKEAGTPSLAAARVAYLMPWGTGTAAAVAEALPAGVRVRTAGRGFVTGGRKHPAGTAIVRVAENGADLRERLAPILSRHGVEAVPVDSGWVDEGISLGSNEVAFLKAPRVLLAWDAPTQSLSAGWARYVLERRYAQRVTAVRVRSLGRVDLRRYDVFVLPSGSYGDALSEDAVDRLRDWVRAGGTLVTLGEASRWAAHEKVGLLETRTQLRDGRPETEPSEKDKETDGSKEARPDDREKPFDLEEAVVPDRERPETTPGALLRVDLDVEHWLSAGADGEVQAMVDGQRVFTPIKLDKGRNVGVYADRDGLVAGGLVWKEAKDLLARKAYLIHQPLGDGHLVAFAEDPNFRAYAEATQLLFVNAVLLGPAN